MEIASYFNKHKVELSLAALTGASAVIGHFNYSNQKDQISLLESALPCPSNSSPASVRVDFMYTGNEELATRYLQAMSPGVDYSGYAGPQRRGSAIVGVTDGQTVSGHVDPGHSQRVSIIKNCPAGTTWYFVEKAGVLHLRVK